MLPIFTLTNVQHSANAHLHQILHCNQSGILVQYPLHNSWFSSAKYMVLEKGANRKWPRKMPSMRSECSINLHTNGKINLFFLTLTLKTCHDHMHKMNVSSAIEPTNGEASKEFELRWMRNCWQQQNKNKQKSSFQFCISNNGIILRSPKLVCKRK